MVEEEGKMMGELIRGVVWVLFFNMSTMLALGYIFSIVGSVLAFIDRIKSKAVLDVATRAREHVSATPRA
jgi:hypothetical protein